MSKLANFNGGRITIGQIYNSIEMMELTDRTLMLCGSFGIGKSASVYKYAYDKGYDIFVFTGGLITKNNIYGVDFIEPEDKCSIHYPAEWYAKVIQSNRKAILFLDDFANALPQEMNILQQILGDRKLGNYDLPPDKFLIVGATNRQQDNANVHTISSPILSRCSVVQVDLNADEFLTYAKSNLHPSIFAFLDKRRWAISDDPEFLKANNVPSDVIGYGAKEASFSTVHPCPRTWKGISDVLYKAKFNVLDESRIDVFREVGVAGLIGSGLAPIFIKSLKTTLNIPSITELISKLDKKYNYADIITSDIEAISSISFTLYQKIVEEAAKLHNLIEDNNVQTTTDKKGNTIYVYKPLDDLLDVLGKLYETQFGSGINCSVIVSSVLDLLGDVAKFKYFKEIISFLTSKEVYREYMYNKNSVLLAINTSLK